MADDDSSILAVTRTDSNGFSLWGIPYLPALPDDMSYCTQYTKIQGSVPHIEDIPINSTLIAITPYVNATCANALMSQAIQDEARLLLFIDTGYVDKQALEDTNYSPITVLLIPATVGSDVLQSMAQYSTNDTYTVPGTNVNGTIQRIGLQAQADVNSGIPKLWIIVLVILAAILLIIVGISLGLNLLQWYRRRDLRRRIRSGEVDLEQLGIKRLTIPEELVAKLPIRTYTHGEQHFHNDGVVPATTHANKPRLKKFNILPHSTPDAKVENAPPIVGFSQTNCPICLEEFEDNVTQVRQLYCDHIYHQECIDPYLKTRSNRCPLCKQGTLPQGYIPADLKLTNNTVRRERAIRAEARRSRGHDGTLAHGDVNLHTLTRDGEGHSHSTATTTVSSLNQPSPPAVVAADPAAPVTPNAVPSRIQVAAVLDDEPYAEEQEAIEHSRQPAWRRAIRHLFPRT